MNLSLNQKLGVLAFVLSLIAMVISVSYSKQTVMENKITVLELAKAIRSREELLLIDVRDQDSFWEFHIPTASSIPLSEIPYADLTTQVPLVIYSGDDSLATKAYSIILNRRISNVALLKGGVHDWYERILYPKIPFELAEQNKALASEIKEIAEFFGGKINRTEDETSLDYYQDASTKSIQTKRETPLVRMGC